MEEFQELSVILSPIEDVSLRNIKEITEERIVYETMFSTNDRNKINSLLSISQEKALEYVREKMIEHISSL